MSYFVADANGYMEDFASIGGMDTFTSWAEHQGGEIARFVDRGFSDNPQALATELQRKHPGAGTVGEMAGHLEMLAGRADSVVILSDGTEPEKMRAAYSPEQERDDHGRWEGPGSPSHDGESRPPGTVVAKSKLGTVTIQKYEPHPYNKEQTKTRYIAHRKNGETVGTKTTVREAKELLRQPKNPDAFPSGYLSPDVEWKMLRAAYSPEQERDDHGRWEANAGEATVASELGLPTSYNGSDSKEKFTKLGMSVDNPLPKTDVISYEDALKIPLTGGSSRDVAVNSLKTTQDYVHPSAVKAYKEGTYMKSQPVVATIKGQEVIINGNHNVLAAKLRGETTISVHHLGVVHPRGRALRAAYSPDQERDDHGRWEGGGTSSTELYHGTTSGSIQSIRARGLQAKFAGRYYPGGSEGGHVYASTDPASAAKYALEAAVRYNMEGRAGTRDVQPVVFKVSIPRSEVLQRDTKDDIGKRGTGLKYKGDIKPEWIKGLARVEYKGSLYNQDRSQPPVLGKFKALLSSSEDGEIYYVPWWLEEPMRSALRATSVHSSEWQHVHQVADHWAPSFAHAVQVAFQAADAAMPSQALRQALEQEDEARVMELASHALAAMERSMRATFPALLTSVLEQAGKRTLDIVSSQLGAAVNRAAANPPKKVPPPVLKKPAVAVQFNVREKDAIDWIEQHGGELIDGIASTTRGFIRDLIESAFSGHARDVGELASAISSAIGDRDRAETIARTETIKAANEGQLLAWDQAKEKGLLNGDEEKQWLVTPDDQLCPICEELDGETVGIDDEFSTGDDSPPAHPNCRCTMVMVLPSAQEE